MRMVKITNIPQVEYQIRHWGKWYWLLNDGQVLKINSVFKKAEDITDER